MLTRVENRGAFWSLLTTRGVYALNWYNVASIFSIIGVEFGQGVSGLGALTSSFYLGVGLLQIPGGLFAGKFGPKVTATFGTLVMSVAVLASAAAGQFEVLIVARFFVGVGMAFVFAPAVVLITRYFRSGAEGVALGLYNSAFDVGGAVGLFGWVIVATTIGWRLSLAASGIMGLLTAALLFFLVPRENVTARFSVGAGVLSRVLLDRTLILLGVVSTGIGVGSILISSFVVYYLITALGVAPATAGGIGALVFVVPIVSSPIGGRVYDRRVGFRSICVIAGVATAAATVLAGFGGIYGPLIAALVGGFTSGLGFTMVLAAARERIPAGPEYRTLSVSWVNSIALTSSFLPPIIFSFIANAFGYTPAWVGGGILCLLLISPIVFIRQPSAA
ncbi:MAG: MFS transporter [Thaumarchaeota archaeon]|nr:MFS transporter [Nitrososphaerota archaeon]